MRVDGKGNTAMDFVEAQIAKRVGPPGQQGVSRRDGNMNASRDFLEQVSGILAVQGEMIIGHSAKKSVPDMD